MDFETAYKLPIGQHVEKKGKFSYLSWCFAVRHLRENFPESTWTIHENEHGLPCFNVGEGFMVKVSVMVNGQIYTQWHPVLNYQNKPIETPSVFDINTSIQRCLTKAIGLATGIGLGLYAGEDLPKDKSDEKPEYNAERVAEYQLEADKCNTIAELEAWRKKASPKAKKELNGTDIKKLLDYFEALRAVLVEKEAKEVFNN